MRIRELRENSDIKQNKTGDGSMSSKPYPIMYTHRFRGRNFDPLVVKIPVALRTFQRAAGSSASVRAGAVKKRELFAKTRGTAHPPISPKNHAVATNFLGCPIAAAYLICQIKK